MDIERFPWTAQQISTSSRSTAEDRNVSSVIDQQMAGVHLDQVQNNPLQPDVYYRGFSTSPLLGAAQGRAQPIQYTISEQSDDQRMAVWSDGLGLLQAPLRIAHFVSDVLWRQVCIDRHALTGSGGAGVYSNELVVVIQPYRGLGSTHIQSLTDPAPGCRVAGFFELDMTIAVQFGLGPAGALYRRVWQGP